MGHDSDADLNDRTGGRVSFAALERDKQATKDRGIDGRAGGRPDDRSRGTSGGYRDSRDDPVQKRDYQANFGRNQDRDRSPNFAYGGQKDHQTQNYN